MFLSEGLSHGILQSFITPIPAVSLLSASGLVVSHFLRVYNPLSIAACLTTPLDFVHCVINKLGPKPQQVVKRPSFPIGPTQSRSWASRYSIAWLLEEPETNWQSRLMLQGVRQGGELICHLCSHGSCEAKAQSDVLTTPSTKLTLFMVEKTLTIENKYK